LRWALNSYNSMSFGRAAAHTHYLNTDSTHVIASSYAIHRAMLA